MSFKFGHIYRFSLPPQEVVFGGKSRKALGIEQYGIHYCLVISRDEFNVSSRGVIVVPLTTGDPGASRVRVISDNKSVWALCEQIRFIDVQRLVRGYEEKMRDYDLRQIQQRLNLILSL